jgi:hypothetical protein
LAPGCSCSTATGCSRADRDRDIPRDNDRGPHKYFPRPTTTTAAPYIAVIPTTTTAAADDGDLNKIHIRWLNPSSRNQKLLKVERLYQLIFGRYSGIRAGG